METNSAKHTVIENKNYPIVISLSEHKGSPLIDIRKHYFDNKSKGIKPIKKGVLLQKNNFNLLAQTLIDS